MGSEASSPRPKYFRAAGVGWILDKQLGAVGVRVEVQALPPLEYDIVNWRQHEAGVTGVQNEVIKYLYYGSILSRPGD